VYIDDLIVAHDARKKGVSKTLLDFVEKYATDNECKVIRVSTGYDYALGRDYYEKNGWDLKAVTYKRSV
jgi:GNAT superfamily N-acetyltransferase